MYKILNYCLTAPFMHLHQLHQLYMSLTDGITPNISIFLKILIAVVTVLISLISYANLNTYVDTN